MMSVNKKGDWIEKVREDLSELSKEELVEKIILKRKETFSKTGKRNVATAKSHERRCKNLLTEWSGVEFRRRRVEGRGNDVSVVEGFADIIPVDADIIFAIESKKGESFSMDSLLATPGKTIFTEWWHQVSYDAQLMSEKTGRKCWPMLFFKPIPAWDWLVIPKKCFTDRILLSNPGINGSRLCVDESFFPDNCWFPHLTFDAYHSMPPVSYNISTSKKNPVMEGLKLEPCIICRWKDFSNPGLTGVDPKSIFV